MSNENGAGESAPGIKTNGTPPPSAGQQKRGPGRPRKENTANGAPLGETPIGGEAKRGRPRKEKVELDRVAVARQIFGTHMMMGSMLGMPEFFLSEKEADTLAEAVCDFAREYDFEPDPKVMAFVNLAAAAGIVYVPRVIKVAVRIKRAKAARANGAQTVDGVATEVKPNDSAPAS